MLSVELCRCSFVFLFFFEREERSWVVRRLLCWKGHEVLGSIGSVGRCVCVQGGWEGVSECA